MENNEKKFVDGVYVNTPNENAPDFVITDISIGENFLAFYKANKNEKGYLKFQVLKSKEGKHYAKLNTWTPDSQNRSNSAQNSPVSDNNSKEVETINPEDLPF